MPGTANLSERGGRRPTPPLALAPGGSARLIAAMVGAVSLWASCQGMTKSTPDAGGQGGAGDAVGGDGGGLATAGQGGAGDAVGGGGGGLAGAGGVGGALVCPTDPRPQNIGGEPEPTIRLGEGGAGGQPTSGGTGGVPTVAVPRDAWCGPGEAPRYDCASDQVCEPAARRCQDSCSSGRTACPYGGLPVCTDLESDKMNCGACGNRCPDVRQTCQAGVCTCPAGFESCDGFCVDLQSNPQNCGACGASCDLSREVCSGGTCTCSASLGFGVSDCGVDVIALTTGVAGDSVKSAAINRSGAVAYLRERPDSSTVFVSSADGVTGIVGARRWPFEGPISWLSVNAKDQVAFAYSWSQYGPYVTTQVQDLYASDGRTLTPIFLQTADQFLWEPRAISDTGRIVFEIRENQATTIMVSDGVVTTRIASTANGEFAGIYQLDSNDAGDVAFVARRDVGQVPSVFIARSGGTTEVPLEGFQGDREDLVAPVINDKGSVVILWDYGLTFVDRAGRRTPLDIPEGVLGLVGIDESDTVAFLDSGGHLVLRSPNGAQRTVVGGGDPFVGSTVSTGDRLFGSTVSSLNAVSFRGQGQLALGVDLADGRSAIVRICVSTGPP